MSEQDCQTSTAPKGCWGKIIGWGKLVGTIIVILAGSLQVYEYLVEGKITEGPLPLQETQKLLARAQQFFTSQRYEKAKQIYQKLLHNHDSTVQAEAVLNLNALRKRGVAIAPHPELQREVSLPELPGGIRLLHRLAKQDIRVTGHGQASPRYRGVQARLMAERAARCDAYRRLAKAIASLKINQHLPLARLMEQDRLGRRLNLTIQGARVTATRILSDHQVEVDMLLPGRALARILRQKS